MDEKQWTTQEKRFYEQFQKMYEEDNCKVPELDRSFLQKDLTVSPPRRTYKKAFRVAAILMIIILSSSATALFIGGCDQRSYSETNVYLEFRCHCYRN